MDYRNEMDICCLTVHLALWAYRAGSTLNGRKQDKIQFFSDLIFINITTSKELRMRHIRPFIDASDAHGPPSG